MMAKDVIAFIHALGYDKVDLLGFSLGGFVSQEILLAEPQLVRKVILAGTGPRGGKGVSDVVGLTYMDMLKGYDRDPFDRSIDVRVTRLRRKIETNPAEPAYIRTVWGQGYLFSPKGLGR